jgi:membrane-associated protein
VARYLVGMETITAVIGFLLNFDVYLKELVLAWGPLVYGLLFLIVFCETGLVVTPFLPGDSLLFVSGTLAGAGLLSGSVLIPLLALAAIAGDACNFHIGKSFGDSLLHRERKWLIKPEHVEKAQDFYRRHGGKAIILARFIPFVRTFVPFVAGIGRMEYRRFWLFNAVGGLLWVPAFVVAGMVFGRVPWVAENLSLLVYGVILVSVLPMLAAWLKSRSARKPALPLPESRLAE